MIEPNASAAAKLLRGAIATEAFAKIEASSANELDAWPEANRESDDSVWLVTFKKHVSDRHITMDQTLDALNSHGWIDGIRRKLDDERTMQLASKRHQQKWSQTYKDSLAHLTAAGATRPWGVRGEIQRILLIGPYARRTWYEDEWSIYFSGYEFWIIVNHPLYTDEGHWERARTTIDHELSNRCAVVLSVFSSADKRSSRARNGYFMMDRCEARLVLSNASYDAPL